MFCSKALFHRSEVWKYNRNEAECDLESSKTCTALNKAFDQVTLSQLAPVSLGRPFGMFLPDMEALTPGLAPVCVWVGEVVWSQEVHAFSLLIPLEHLLSGFYAPLARIRPEKWREGEVASHRKRKKSVEIPM